MGTPARNRGAPGARGRGRTPHRGARARRHRGPDRGGGDHLSDGTAYRNAPLRDTTGRGRPAGHVHTPVPRFGTADGEVITDEVSERDRAGTAGQVQAIVPEAVAVRP
ncbi:hypothetical protein [Nocardiopsis quinghaiensis]|uniref:hypothetical protein n=1 Tax=Nocardiopsis quinghaiensis TaxID=464995 RepID=UPI0016809927|nr:hypothetical protein [Nocardiopsis quinghaiensis]